MCMPYDKRYDKMWGYLGPVRPETQKRYSTILRPERWMEIHFEVDYGNTQSITHIMYQKTWDSMGILMQKRFLDNFAKSLELKLNQVDMTRELKEKNHLEVRHDV